MNNGKIFEEQIKKSIPNYVLFYRIHDSAQSFGGSNTLRFSLKNPFDFIMWDSKRFTLFALEMKTVDGSSISFERSKKETGLIHYHQIEGLNNWNRYDGIVCGFIIEFRKLTKTVFIDIDSFNLLLKKIDKKSFNYKDLKTYGIPHIVIPQKLLKKRYKYDIEDFLNKIHLLLEEKQEETK